ncbi:MAG TPA: hypothetical protein VK944_06430, partial [Candidatus Limnocylindria bacterium]|nr:hypothetical protein [Candidatus Limnocylindria bacterium]
GRRGKGSDMRGKEKTPSPENVRVEEELSSCPRCGYGGGFHVAFRRRGRSLNVFLICPSCSDRFSAGEWAFPAGESAGR